MKKQIAGCIILYQPEAGFVSNIETYAHGLDMLIVVDNSPTDHRAALEGLNDTVRIEYYHTGANDGMARALNMACARAEAAGYRWLLTMDQDSSFMPGDFEKLTDAIGEAEKAFPRIGILTPYHDVHEQFRKLPAESFSTLSGTMTSGNLLRLAAWRDGGLFEEKLFIDYVDHEFCLRLRKKEYAVVQYNRVLLKHALGHFVIRSVFGRKMGVSNHNALRRYYKVRNGLYTLWKHYRFDPPFGNDVLRNLLTDFMKIIFFENNKLAKTGATMAGTWHFIIGRYGKYK